MQTKTRYTRKISRRARRKKVIVVAVHGPVRIPNGRYITLAQYVREHGLNYQIYRAKLLAGKTRKRFYKVGRAWILPA